LEGSEALLMTMSRTAVQKLFGFILFCFFNRKTDTKKAN